MSDYIPDPTLPAPVRARIERNLAEAERAAKVREENFKREMAAREAEEKRLEAEAEASRVKLAAERAAMAEKAEAEAKERARAEYPFSDESFEQAWPTIRAALAAAEIAAKRARLAHPSGYMHGLTGGHGDAIEPSPTFGPVDRG